MFSVKQGSWDQLQQDAKLIRELVFISEQNIPEQDEWDDQDAISQHFVVYDQNQPIATARLLANNSVGRVAVLKAYRGQGRSIDHVGDYCLRSDSKTTKLTAIFTSSCNFIL